MYVRVRVSMLSILSTVYNIRTVYLLPGTCTVLYIPYIKYSINYINVLIY